MKFLFEDYQEKFKYDDDVKSYFHTRPLLEFSPF